MKRSAPTLASIVLMVGLTAACSDGNGDDTATEITENTAAENTSEATETVGTAEPSEPASSTSDDTSAPSTPAPTTPAPTTLPATTVPDTGPPRLTGLTPIELATALNGGGERPLLEWEAVDGADTYGVFLYAPDDAVYWSWQGAEASIHVGGSPQLPESMPGPSVTDGMSWSVVAYDADLVPIASSENRAISP